MTSCCLWRWMIRESSCWNHTCCPPICSDHEWCFYYKTGLVWNKLKMFLLFGDNDSVAAASERFCERKHNFHPSEQKENAFNSSRKIHLDHWTLFCKQCQATPQLRHKLRSSKITTPVRKQKHNPVISACSQCPVHLKGASQVFYLISN